jgi:hypothetical protein
MVLQALPEFDEGLIESVLSHRAGPDGRAGTADDAYLESAEDFARIEGLTPGQIAMLQADFGRFDTDVFRVYSVSRVGSDAVCGLMATLREEDGRVGIVSLERAW